jgi:hypothetical protein
VLLRHEHHTGRTPTNPIDRINEITGRYGPDSLIGTIMGARALGRFVAWGEIARDVVEEAFQAAGEAAGLPPRECRATIRSALDWSIRTARPRDAA